MEPDNDKDQSLNDVNQRSIEQPEVPGQNPESTVARPEKTDNQQPAVSPVSSTDPSNRLENTQHSVSSPVVPEAANTQPSVEKVSQSSNKKLAIILLGVAICVIAAFVIFKVASKQAEAPSNKTTTTSNPQSAQQTTAPLTSTEVAKHNSKEDCWTIISGQVYNLTDFVSQHPGGSEILRACGIDGTSLFAERETSDGQKVGSGTPHSSSAGSQLETFLLGPVEQ